MESPISVGSALQLINQDTDLRTLVYVTIARIGVPIKYHDQCCQAAAQLWASGWLHSQLKVQHNGYGAETEQESTRRIAKTAWQELRKAGVIPSGLIDRIRWHRAVWPFLRVLISTWLPA